MINSLVQTAGAQRAHSYLPLLPRSSAATSGDCRLLSLASSEASTRPDQEISSSLSYTATPCLQLAPQPGVCATRTALLPSSPSHHLLLNPSSPSQGLFWPDFCLEYNSPHSGFQELRLLHFLKMLPGDQQPQGLKGFPLLLLCNTPSRSGKADTMCMQELRQLWGIR